jgi:hypothetical protein
MLTSGRSTTPEEVKTPPKTTVISSSKQPNTKLNEAFYQNLGWVLETKDLQIYLVHPVSNDAKKHNFQFLEATHRSWVILLIPKILKVTFQRRVDKVSTMIQLKSCTWWISDSTWIVQEDKFSFRYQWASLSSKWRQISAAAAAYEWRWVISVIYLWLRIRFVNTHHSAKH